MGCPAQVELEDNLVFSICTHDPDTGVLTDADAAPAYRVYEDETATPILTGTMAKLDDANTVGFYTESIACTATNGFEDGKTYTVYIEATVDSDTGGIAYGFKCTASPATAAELAKVPKSDGAVTWNATALASLQSEANDAKVALKLDHLIAVADADDVVDNSIIAKLAAKGATADWSDFVNTTDSLQANSDNVKLVQDDTNELQTDWVNGGRLDLLLDSIIGDGDTGITLAKLKEIVAAFVAGKVTASSAGGITTYTYKKRDGSTTSFTAACSETDGTRATTGNLS